MQLLSVFFDYYVFTSSTHVPKGVIVWHNMLIQHPFQDNFFPCVHILLSFSRTTSMTLGMCSISLQSLVASSTSSSQSFRWVLSLENETWWRRILCLDVYLNDLFSDCLSPTSLCVAAAVVRAAQIYPFMNAVIVAVAPCSFIMNATIRVTHSWMQLPELYRSAPLWVVVSELRTVLCKRYYIFKKEKKEEWMTVVTTILQLHMHYPFMGATIRVTLYPFMNVLTRVTQIYSCMDANNIRVAHCPAEMLLHFEKKKKRHQKNPKNMWVGVL